MTEPTSTKAPSFDDALVIAAELFHSSADPEGATLDWRRHLQSVGQSWLTMAEIISRHHRP